MHRKVLGRWIVWLESKEWGFSSKGTNASVFPAVLHKSSYLNTGVVKISISIFCSGWGTFPSVVQHVSRTAY